MFNTIPWYFLMIKNLSEEVLLQISFESLISDKSFN